MISGSHARWLSRDAPHGDGGLIEALVFGTRDHDQIDERVSAWCATQIASPVIEILFRAASVGVVVGVRLDDGRRVVVKAHQPRESRATLEAVHDAQRGLFLAGFPCPEPLLGPTALGRGFGTIETMVDAGDFQDTHDPTRRRLIAQALARHLELIAPHGRPAALTGGWNLYGGDALWPRMAHSPIFDLDATADGAQWIDRIAIKAKPLAAMPGELIVGHHDWSGKHFRFIEDRISAVYDWDSLRLGREAVIIGNAAMTYTTNFNLPAINRAPSPDEMRAFIDEYSAARPTPLNRNHRQQIAACATFLAAYTARCEHCGHDGYNGNNDPNSFMTALRDHGLNYLDA